MPIDMRGENMRLFLQELPTETEWQGRKTTKAFKKGGGFSGTSLDAMYVVGRLTSLFGPVGRGWGLRLNRAWEVDLGPAADGKPRVNQYVHATFWYWRGGERCEFDVCGGTPLQGFGDDDALKKGLTDCLTKGASWLGIGGDVHLGKFDDNKYIAEREQETRSAAREQAAADKASLRQSARMVRQAFEEAMDLDQLAEARGQALRLVPQVEKAGLGDEAEALRRVFEEARLRLAPPKQAAE